jgi:hypothetical protein
MSADSTIRRYDGTAVLYFGAHSPIVIFGYQQSAAGPPDKFNFFLFVGILHLAT